MTSSISASDPFRLGARQIDLVDHRQDFEIVIQRHVNVGDGLRFHALGGVDHQQRAFAGRQTARHFIGEIDMARRIDQD